jgi:aryl-alcohol dehydrogenase-like predicted oxidoreductase
MDLLFHTAGQPRPLKKPFTRCTYSESGKAIYWGTSEWDAAEIVAAIEIAERHHLHKPVMEQPRYNLIMRKRFEQEYARLFRDYGYGSTTWSPLHRGVLTGKYNNGIPADSRGALPEFQWLHDRLTDQRNIEKVKRLQSVADDLGVSIAKLSIAWCLKNPYVSTVITGASRVEQVHENMKALDVLPLLTPDVMARIDQIFD